MALHYRRLPKVSATYRENAIIVNQLHTLTKPALVRKLPKYPQNDQFVL